jgi:hypothetical protein
MTRPIAVLLLVVWSCVYNARANYLLFDAVTDSVQIDGQTPYGGSFTFEAVVVFTPSHNGGGDVFVELTPGQAHKLLGVGTNFITGYNAPRGGSSFSVTGLALSLYQPHHIAYVSEQYEYVSEQYEERMYLDGQLVGSRATATATVGSGWIKGCLGGGTFGTGWVGYIDSLRLSDSIRYVGSEFIPPLGDMTADGNTLLLYNFNESPGSLTVADLSGNGRTGSLGMGNISGATSPEFVSKVPAPPALSIMSQDGFRLAVSNLIPGWVHVLETRTSLTTGSWTPNTEWVATGTQTNMPIGMSGEKQFFRLRARP